MSGAFSLWGPSEANESLRSGEMLGGEGAAVGERMDHRGSLLWGRYEMDCWRLVAGRFESGGVVDNGETSELEEVLESESMFEIERCSGRGGNECRLVGVVISKLSVGGIPGSEHWVRRKSKEKQELTAYRLGVDTDDVLVGNYPKSVSSSANERSPPRFLCYRVGLAGHNFGPRAWLAGDQVAVQYRLQRAYV